MPPSFAGNMTEQIKRLQLFFKRKDVDLLNDEGDKNSNSKYCVFIDPNQVEVWSIVLVPITDLVRFKAKFYTIDKLMSISVDECVKDVVSYKNNILFVHCKMTESTPYCFTICTNNSKSPFSTLYFLKSLENSVYEPLMKEIEEDIDRKQWHMKDGLPLRARPIASKVRQIIFSMAKMAATRHTLVSAIMPITLSRGRGTQGDN